MSSREVKSNKLADGKYDRIFQFKNQVIKCLKAVPPDWYSLLELISSGELSAQQE